MSRIISQKDWRALLKLNIYSLSKQSKDAVPRRLTHLLWLYSQLGPITNSAQEAQPTRPLDNTNSAQWSTNSAHQLGPIISQLGPVIKHQSSV